MSVSVQTSDPRSSLWYWTAPAAPETPPLEESGRYDVAVIGGGYTGLSAALHLAAGGARVVLLEARDPGFGASGRNHGQVVPVLGRYGPEELVARLGPELGERMNAWIAASADLVFELIRRHGIDCDGLQTGWLMPVDSPARHDMVKGRYEAWARRGAAVKWLDKRATDEITGSPAYYGALLHDKGGNIQPLSYARGLARAALAAGAVLHGQSPATALRREGERWRIETPRASVEAEAVILATNAYSESLWPGVKETVVPFRLFLAATAPLGENVARSILPGRQSISDSRTVLWPFRFDRENRLVTGSDHLLPFASRAQAARIMAKKFRRTFPQIGDFEVQYVWEGKVAMTMDRLPRYLEPAPGLFAGLGYSGRGIALATAMGKLLAERALARTETALPLPQGRSGEIPLHGLVVPFGRLMLLPYKLRDWRAGRSRARG
jgi:glycine/D-amino acid oxidase-like deaminating enzyme